MSKKENFIAVFKKYFRKDEIFLFPNILCYLRVILIIVFLCLYFIPFSIAGNEFANYYLAAAVVVLAAYTDFLDGLVARKFRQVSQLGKIIDPIADKLLQLAVAAGLCYTLRDYPIVYVMLGVFIIKELIMALENIILAQHNKAFGSAHWYGKFSSFVFYVVLGVLLVAAPFIINSYAEFLIPDIVFNTMCGVVILVLLFASINYHVLFFKLLKHGPDEIDFSKDENKEEEND